MLGIMGIDTECLCLPKTHVSKPELLMQRCLEVGLWEVVRFNQGHEGGGP